MLCTRAAWGAPGAATPRFLLRVSCVSCIGCPCMAMPCASPGSDVARFGRALGSRDVHSSGVTLHGCSLLHLLCASFSFRGCTVELVVVFDVPHAYKALSFGVGGFSQCGDLKIMQDLSDGFPGAKSLLVPWKWLVGIQCKTLQQNLAKGELRLPLVCYVLGHILQTSEDLERASD